MAELLVTLADGRSKRLKLGQTPQVMGRDGDCDLPIDDPSASRRHARFSLTPEGYVLEDLGSKNGTMVNDAPCSSTVLRDGDRVQLGSTVAIYSESASRVSQPVVVADDLTRSRATRYVSSDQALDLSRQRLQMIYDLSDRLITLQGKDELLEDALSIGFETLQFERGAIGIKRAHGRGLDWPVVRNLYGAEGELTISRSLLNRALEHGERAIFSDSDLGMGDPTVSMVQHGIRSAMCVPLVHQNEILGVIYGDRIRTSGSYSNEDIDFLAAIGRQVSIGLVNCRLVEEQQQMLRLKQDVELARKIQTGLFPDFSLNKSGVKVAALNDPGQRVSGDYYDFVETDDGRVWCLVADVTGEGVAAALLTANLQAAVRVTIHQTDDPSALLERWNRLICHNTDSSKFVTCVLALIDPAARQIRYASAGHCTPFLLCDESSELTELAGETGFPLGVVESATFPTTTLDAPESPFSVFFYSDGVIEAMNTKEEMFGMDGLRRALKERRDLNPQTLTKHVRKCVASFVGAAPPSDDITILVATVQ